MQGTTSKGFMTNHSKMEVSIYIGRLRAECIIQVQEMIRIQSGVQLGTRYVADYQLSFIPVHGQDQVNRTELVLVLERVLETNL